MSCPHNGIIIRHDYPVVLCDTDIIAVALPTLAHLLPLLPLRVGVNDSRTRPAAPVLETVSTRHPDILSCSQASSERDRPLCRQRHLSNMV